MPCQKGPGGHDGQAPYGTRIIGQIQLPRSIPISYSTRTKLYKKSLRPKAEIPGGTRGPKSKYPAGPTSSPPRALNSFPRNLFFYLLLLGVEVLLELDAELLAEGRQLVEVLLVLGGGLDLGLDGYTG